MISGCLWSLVTGFLLLSLVNIGKKTPGDECDKTDVVILNPAVGIEEVMGKTPFEA